MFTCPEDSGRKRWSGALAASFALHCVVLLLLVRRASPVFVVPSDVDFGIPRSSGSASIVYLAPVGPELQSSEPENPQPAAHASLLHTLQPPRTRSTHQSKATSQSNLPEQTARGGSPYGRVPGAPLTGDEVIPALPEVFPDPPVSRADLPAGVEGDVIVEVTIDADGNVVETKLLQSLGYGIEQKVLSALQRWHFRPAMRDGVNIASQHVVYFHYPS
jgi:TonB family protein